MSLPFKTSTSQELFSDWSMYTTVLHMVKYEWKVRLHDPKGMLLEVSVSPKKTIFFKYNRHLILIRLQQTYMEILIVISSMLKYLLLIFYHCVRHDLDLQLSLDVNVSHEKLRYYKDLIVIRLCIDERLLFFVGSRKD
jgi:hypothetical protein